MISYPDLQSAHIASATATPGSWSKMPSDDSKISRLLFWWLTLDTEFQRHVYEATIIQGELSPLLRLIPTPDDPTDPVYLDAIAARNAIILTLPVEPIQPIVLATTLEVSLHQLSLNSYDRKLKLFHAQRVAMQSLKTNMLASIDETTKSLCFPDKTTLTTTSFHEIYHLVSDNFSTPTPSHIESVNSILAEPFTYSNPNSYDNHVAKHLDAHIARTDRPVKNSYRI